MDATIFKVKAVSLALTKSNPPGMIIHAAGEVTTSGWSNGRLSPYVYLTPPKDGIWDFTFIATMPKGIALTVISHIEATADIYPMPGWCKGVRIHAGSNVMESGESALDPATVLNIGGPNLFSDKAKLAPMRAGADGVDFFPWATKE